MRNAATTATGEAAIAARYCRRRSTPPAPQWNQRVSSGAGAEARESIGWVVFGGLGLAALFTLYLTPTLYLLLARFSAARAAESERLAAEMREACPIVDSP